MGRAGLQLGRVFRARDQTAAQSINTSQDRSHRRASLTTSAPLGALKTLPAPRMLLAWQSEAEELRGSRGPDKLGDSLRSTLSYESLIMEQPFAERNMKVQLN